MTRIRQNMQVGRPAAARNAARAASPAVAGGRLPRSAAPPMAHRRYRPDTLRWALVALLVVSLSRIHNYLGIGALRPALVLTALAGAYALANPRVTNSAKLLRFWPAKVMAALGAMACLSAAFGISLGGSASFFLQEYSKVLVTAFLVIAAIRRVGDLRLFVWAYVISCGILAYFAVFVFDLKATHGMLRLNQMYTFDSNDVALIMATGLPLVLLVYQTATVRGRAVAGTILLGIGATLARGGSRGGLVAMVAVGGFLLFWTPGISMLKRFALVGVAGLGLVVAAPPGYWTQMETILSPKEDYNWDSYYGRRKLAERGMGYMLSYPVFGVGAGNFPRADGTLSDRAQNFVDRIGYRNQWRAAHNSYVQAGAEMGIPGLVLFVTLVFGPIGWLRRLRRQLPRAWLKADPDRRFLYLSTVYLPVSLVGFAVGCFFVSFAYIDVIYVLAAFAVGTYASVAAMTAGDRAPVDADAGNGRPAGSRAIAMARKRALAER